LAPAQENCAYILLKLPSFWFSYNRPIFRGIRWVRLGDQWISEKTYGNC